MSGLFVFKTYISRMVEESRTTTHILYARMCIQDVHARKFSDTDFIVSLVLATPAIMGGVNQ